MAKTEIQELKTIKIPECEYNKLKEARNLLAMKGIDSLNQDAKREAERGIKDYEKLTLGVIIGIGMTLLIEALAD